MFNTATGATRCMKRRADFKAATRVLVFFKTKKNATSETFNLSNALAFVGYRKEALITKEMSGEKVKPQGNGLQRTVRAERNYFRLIKLGNFTIKVPLVGWTL